MRLGVNVVRLTRPFTGVGRYVDCLLREWSELALPFEEVVLLTPRALDPTRLTFPLDRYRQVIGGLRLPDPIWEWQALSPRVRGIDLLFCPSYTLPLGYRGRAAVSYFGPATNTPGSFEWWRARAYEALYRYSVRHAAHVFTASGWVRRRVIERCGARESAVEAIPLAPARHFKRVDAPAELERVRRKYLGTDDRYVLFVGKLSGRHYIPELLEAFARIRGESSTAQKLLLVGPDVLGLGIPERVGKLGLVGSVTHVGYVPDADLPALYSAADVFVFPASEAEGFGMPVVEAMACGTPVVSTALGSVPEVAGDAALLAPSNTPRALADTLGRALRDADLRQDLGRLGLARASRLSWKRTAEKTMASLWRVAAGLE